MSIFDSILHCCCEGPYIPPCQRNSYYDDLRDVQLMAETDVFNELIQCRECGVYFPKRLFMNANSDLCNECLKKEFDRDRK